MRVTIGVPFYNNARTLADCVRSVMAQTYDDWELILVDDGSSDGSAEMAASIRDPRIRTLTDGSNRGLSHRLNQLAAIAEGEYLTRMDADDLMHPERIARQVEWLDRRPEIDLVDCGAYSLDFNNDVHGIRGMDDLDARPASILAHNFLFHPCVMGRAEWFRRNPYNEDLRRAEDLDLWCRTFNTTRFGRIHEPLLFYREDAISVKTIKRSLRDVRRIYRAHGPKLVGWALTARLSAATYLKAGAYDVFTALGLQGRLLQRRNTPIDEEARTAARAILATILSVPVPGLEGYAQPPAAVA
ncbi:MAG TPA: glycosyltransferase [Armatimonadota bacterium]|jgi:glycosyltransferase involved in cell wall biosynthesis